MKCKAYVQVGNGIEHTPCPKLQVINNYCEEHQCFVGDNKSEKMFEKLEKMFCISKINHYLKQFDDASSLSEKRNIVKDFFAFLVNQMDFLTSNKKFFEVTEKKLIEFKNSELFNDILDWDKVMEDIQVGRLLNCKNGEYADNYNFEHLVLEI